MQYQLLLQIIVCPLCHAHLFLDVEHKKLICHVDNMVFLINQGIPVLLSQEDYDLVSRES